ncbi:MAG: hypothetical protein HY701_07770, partial [Gemmatimonadetes bacterium]|nr:hypothetical protein [Gemmatimonadota bacterium]
MKTSVAFATSALIGLMGLAAIPTQAAAQEATPRRQPGASITLYAPEQHDLYDGRFVLSAGRVYQLGSLNDAAGWD